GFRETSPSEFFVHREWAPELPCLWPYDGAPACLWPGTLRHRSSNRCSLQEPPARCTAIPPIPGPEPGHLEIRLAGSRLPGQRPWFKSPCGDKSIHICFIEYRRPDPRQEFTERYFSFPICSYRPDRCHRKGAY